MVQLRVRKSSWSAARSTTWRKPCARLGSAAQHTEDVVIEARLYEVGIGATRREKDRAAAAQRILTGTLHTQHVDAGDHMRSFRVAGPAGEVDDAAGPAAVLRRIGTLVHLNVLHHLGVEGAEESEEVIDVVNRHTVQQHQVLVRGAAAHEEASGLLVRPGDPGHQLDGAEDVDLTDVGQHDQLRRRYGDLADVLSRLHDPIDVRDGGHLIELDGHACQRDLERLGLRCHIDDDLGGLVSKGGDAKNDHCERNIKQHEVTFTIGYRLNLCAYDLDRREGERLVVQRVAQGTGDRPTLSQ